jgi:hypothetical protein
MSHHYRGAKRIEKQGRPGPAPIQANQYGLRTYATPTRCPLCGTLNTTRNEQGICGGCVIAAHRGDE